MPSSSAPAGASGVPSNSGPRASAYQPAAQPQFDASLQAAMAALPITGNLTPGGWAYPQAQNLTAGALDPNNPYLSQAIGAGQNAYDTFNANFSGVPGFIGGQLSNYENMFPQMLGEANYASSFAPMLAGGGANLINFGSGLAGGLANYTDAAAASLYGGAQNLLDRNQQDVQQLTPLVQGGAANLANYGGQVLNTAFDPQNALFNQLSQQVQNQANAANAVAGLGSTAYGAGTTGNTLSNFDINWQNQQLGRQATGLGAAEGAYGQIPGLLSSPTSLYGSGLNLAGQAFGQIPGLLSSPVNLLSSTLSGAINPLAASANLATAPASALTAAFGPLGTGANAGANLLSQLQSFAGLPYSTQNTGANNALSLLGGATTLGNNQFTIPQQAINDFQSYLGLGQAASGLSGQLGNLGQQQLFNSLSGLGGAANLGSQLLTGQSLGSLAGGGQGGGLLGLAGLNPLFSSAGSDFAGSVPGFVGLGNAAPAFGFDAAGTALAGATDFGGGVDFGSLLASALPFAAAA